MIVRNANFADITDILELGKDQSFSVSEQIPFYEESELKQWITYPEDNLLCVIETDDKVVGFLFCKIMSHHWAYLDNFYCNPRYRGRGYGKQMLDYMTKRLKEKNIEYLTTMIEHGRDDQLDSFFLKQGFDHCKSYYWMEKFVD